MIHIDGDPLTYRRRLKHDAAKFKDASTDSQKGDIAHRHLLLQKRLVLFQEIQSCFMPEVIGLCMSAADTQSPESLHLFLPHEAHLPLSLTAAGQHLLSIESKLRHAQASDSLTELCQSLTVYSHPRMSKIQEATGQKALMRANTLLQKSKDWTDVIANKYRVARSTLLQLQGPGSWELHFKELKTEDVRPMTDSEERPNASKKLKANPPSVSHQTLSKPVSYKCISS